MKKIKVAVVGVGRLGRNHARWLKQIDCCQMVGVYDSDQARADEVAAEFDLKAFASLEQALEAADALTIATPTTSHHQVGMQALESGRHLLIEKPIASTMPQARELVEAAERKSLTLAVGHIERFNPAFLAVKDISLRPRFIEAHRLAAFDPRASDVAVILDLMVHDIDLALTLMDSPVEEIHASAVPVITEWADIANVRITFASGAVSNLTASRISLQPMRKMRIFERSGYYSLDFSSKRADLYNLDDSEALKSLDAEANGGSAMKIPLGKSGREIVYRQRSVRADEDMLKMELEAFLAAVGGSEPVVVSGQAGMAALEVALEVERVAQQGRLLE